MKRRTFTAPVAAPLSAVVAGATGVSPEDAAKWVSAGAVYVEGRRCREPERVVPAGAVVLAVLEESGKPPAGDRSPSLRAAVAVLREDAQRIAVDKPAGALSQSGPSGQPSLLEEVSALLGRPAGLVHRLDKETSGVMLFAKTKQATSELAGLFRDGAVRKLYLAVVRGPLPDRGEVDLPLSKDPSRPGRWRASRTANGVPAATSFEVLHRGEFTVVALRPRTGRTHQLRAHLRALGAPIVGDRLYEGDRSASRCLLHARQLTLPDGFDATAPIPQDMHALWPGFSTLQT